MYEYIAVLVKGLKSTFVALGVLVEALPVISAATFRGHVVAAAQLSKNWLVILLVQVFRRAHQAQAHVGKHQGRTRSHPAGAGKHDLHGRQI